MASSGLRPGMASMVLSASLALLGCHMVRDPAHSWMVPAGFWINIACMFMIWLRWAIDALDQHFSGTEEDEDEEDD